MSVCGRRLLIVEDEPLLRITMADALRKEGWIVDIAEDGVRIEDLNSSNGTIVNMKKMSRADIEADDLMIIGDFRIHAIPAED